MFFFSVTGIAGTPHPSRLSSRYEKTPSVEQRHTLWENSPATEEYHCMTTVAGPKPSRFHFNVEPDFPASWCVDPKALWRQESSGGMGEAVGPLTRGKMIPGHQRPGTLWTLDAVGGCVWLEDQALTAFILSTSASRRQFWTRFALIWPDGCISGHFAIMLLHWTWSLTGPCSWPAVCLMWFKVQGTLLDKEQSCV